MTRHMHTITPDMETELEDAWQDGGVQGAAYAMGKPYSKNPYIKANAPLMYTTWADAFDEAYTSYMEWQYIRQQDAQDSGD